MIGRRVIQVALYAWLMCVTLVSAQPPRPEGRDKFFDALGEAHRQLLPRRELVGLLWHDSVQKEVGLSPENYQKIEQLRREEFNKVMALRDELKDQALSKEEIVKKIIETQAPIDQQLYELLHNPEHANFDRLLGIYVQSRSFSAATNETVAERIGLVGDAYLEYRKARGEIWHQLMDENREKMGNLIREGDRKKISRLFEEAEKKLNSSLAAKLTNEQRTALQQLEGEKFDLPKQPFDFRGPRGRRGGGGDRERGDRERGDRDPNNPPSNEKAKDCEKENNPTRAPRR
jgi:hypothetical protein